MFRAKDDLCLVTVFQYQNNFPFDLYTSMSFSYFFAKTTNTSWAFVTDNLLFVLLHT